MSIEATTVMLAIQAGVRLYGAATKAYAVATTNRPLELPLIEGGGTADAADAFRWFTSRRGPARQLRRDVPNARLEALLDKQQQDLTDAEQTELVTLFREYNYFSKLQQKQSERESEPALLDRPLGPDELNGALLIAQWAKNESAAGAGAVQIVAGELVNIAVAYFAQTPGAVDDERPEGRAIKAFLLAFSDTDFSAEAPKSLVPQVFSALLESLSANPGVLVSGPKEQAFVTNFTKSLGESIGPRLSALTRASPAAADAFLDARFPELIARAVFEGGMKTVLAHPRHYLGAGGDEQKLVKPVLETLMGLVLTEQGIDPQRALSREGLERLTQVAAAALAENPGIISLDGEDAGLELVIRETVEALAVREQLLTQDLLPEIVRLVLERTAANLKLVARIREPDTGQLILVGATRELLEALSNRNEDGGWSLSPQLSEAQLLAFAEHTLDQVVDNPAWIAGRIAGQQRPVLRLALDAALAALREAPADGLDRLNADTAVAVLQASITAVALNHELVTKRTASGKQALTEALKAVIEALLLGDVTTSPQRWRLMSNRTVLFVIEVVLERLASHGASDEALDLIRAKLQELLDATLSPDALPDALDAALSSLPGDAP